MPYGAHETMETHEVLMEKITMINHMALYAQQCQDSELRSLVQRQLQQATQGYQNLVQYTHEYIEPTSRMSSGIHQQVQPDQIQYGLSQPAPQAPQLTAGAFNDQQIAGSLLNAHKNSAKNHMAASLECADPNLRQIMVNGALACEQQAYEIFLYMNRNGMYQVPTMDDHTAKTFLHIYRMPAEGQEAFTQTAQQTTNV